MVEILLPIAVFMILAAMLGLITRLIATAFLNRTIREALRHDPSSVPILAERLDRRQPWGDGLLGWIFMALAIAMLLLGLTEEDFEQRRDLLRFAIVPAMVGITIIIYTRLATRSSTGI